MWFLAYDHADVLQQMKGAVLLSFFSSGNSEYHQVCGRAIGYQNGSTDAFGRLVVSDLNQTIDDVFVDGLSLTYGTDQRKHIWTFVAWNSEVIGIPREAVQCLPATVVILTLLEYVHHISWREITSVNQLLTVIMMQKTSFTVMTHYGTV